MRRVQVLWLTIVVFALLSAACGGSAPTPAPAAPAAPAATQPTSGGGGDAVTRGQTAFGQAGCVTCHGDKAQGNVFPGAAKLAATTLTCDQIRTQVRTPKDPAKGMPAFAAAQISDVGVNDICAWVKSLP